MINSNKQNKLEIEKSKIDFDHLWKIKEIDVNIATFEKYAIHPEMSIGNPNNSNISLKELIGTEKHKLTPDIQLELSGKVGEIIKEFESVKHNNGVRIKKIIWL